MRRLLLLAPLGALALSACATPKQSAAEALAPELQVHSVPEGAEVSVDGRKLGVAPVVLPVRKGQGNLKVSLTRANYFPSEVVVDASAVFAAGGGSAWVPLRSENMGTERDELDPKAAEDIVLGGVYATKAGRCDEALQFFSRALAVNPGVARAYRDRARCLLKLGRRDEAIHSLEQYLLAQPDAPDAPAVQEQIAKAHGRMDIDLSEPTAKRAPKGK